MLLDEELGSTVLLYPSTGDDKFHGTQAVHLRCPRSCIPGRSCYEDGAWAIKDGGVAKGVEWFDGPVAIKSQLEWNCDTL
ncbi:hypothetical protein FH972_024910 [Carpinus fangiana]|uniref:Uncharacterized protein n=1 Tax=Carpinus fangiana TaxID=176857 RepID=A0A5N6KZH7_9ROSI|nr:hypothetical protein FH972_024910 [Carpinus fangiana]